MAKMATVIQAPVAVAASLISTTPDLSVVQTMLLGGGQIVVTRVLAA
jgi:hypothetical protein